MVDKKGHNICNWLALICFLFGTSIGDYILKIALQIRVGQRSITTSLWPLTAHIYHVMIIVTGGFSEKSFFIIIFTRSRTQMFFKTGVTRNFAIFTGKYLCWSLTACNFISTLSHKSLEHRWLLWKLRNFSENFFLWNTSSCCFCQFDKVTVQCWGSAKLLFLIYKTKYMGLFLLTRFIDPVSMLYTHYW